VGGNFCAGRAVAHANSTSSLGGRLFGDDLADEGLEFRWGLRDLKGFAEHGFGFVEERGVFAKEGDDGLVGFEFVTEFGVHLDAGVGADWVAGFGAACSEALDGPAYLFAVHGCEIAGLRGVQGANDFGFVLGGWVLEDADVAILGFDDL